MSWLDKFKQLPYPTFDGKGDVMEYVKKSHEIHDHNQRASHLVQRVLAVVILVAAVLAIIF